MSKNLTWYKIAITIDDLGFGVNELIKIEVAGKEICIANKGNQLSACAAKCPHAGGNLADGFKDAMGNIVCPVHGYKFNLVNGRNVSGEGYHLKIYPIEVREDGIYVGILAGGLIHW